MTGALLLAWAALRRDRVQVVLWALGLMVGGTVCAINIATGYPAEADRIAALQVAIDNPALLIGRGLPRGSSAGAFLFYTYGVVFGTVFAVFATFFAVRHGRAEEDDGTRELLRAVATGRLASLVAVFVAGSLACIALAAALVLGLVIGGAEFSGSVWAGVACALVGAVFLVLGALVSQAASTARMASGLGAVVMAVFFLVRVAADVQADIDPHTLVGEPVLLGWLTPFSLGLIVDPYGTVNPAALGILGAAAVGGAVGAMAIERRREFGASLLTPRPGPAVAAAGLGSPWRLALRLQRGTLLGMMLAGFVVGGFAAILATLALGSEGENEAIRDIIESLVGQRGPLYDLLLSYVMVLVGECAAIAGALAVLRARREEAAGNAEAVRAAGIAPWRWFGSALGVGMLSILLVLATAWLGAAAVYLAHGLGASAVWQVLAASVAQLPATGLYLGLIAVVFAALPRLTGPFAWTILAVGVVLAELGGRLGLPDWVITLSPFVHTPLVTTANPEWGGAIVMSGMAVAAVAVAMAAYRRRDLSP